MKLNTAFSEETVESIGTEKSIAFGFDENSDEMIFAMFTKNIYSNPIGSIVREITSNCFDSHKEANINEPVVIRLIKENGQHYIQFIDVGVGMSPERIATIYAKYFKTTKRGDNNQIGGFGIGGKTPLAYTDSFYIVTNFNGKKYYYCIYKGQKSPVIDLLSTEDTIERNGTTVKVPIKGSDIYNFEREINRQLYYFENVIFEGFSNSVINEYVIYTGQNFLYRGNDYSSKMHICLGRVAYPIDYNAIGIDEREHSIPVALRFDIGELNVGASRESLEYNDHTKKMIKLKIEAAKQELKDMLLAQHKNISTIKDYYQCKDAYGRLVIDAKKDVSIFIGTIAKSSELVYPKYKALPFIPSASSVVDALINIRTIGNTGKKRYRKETWDGGLLTMHKWHNLIFTPVGTKRKRRVQAYLKAELGVYVSISPVKDAYDEKFDQILKDVFLTKSDGKVLPSSPEIEKEAMMLMDEVMGVIKAETKHYDSIVVPEYFEIPKRNVVNEVLLDHEIPVNAIAGGYDRTRVILRQLHDFKGTIVYGFKDDERTLSNYYELTEQLDVAKSTKNNYRDYLLGSNKKIKFIAIAKGNEGFVKNFKNVIHHSLFIKKFIMKKRDKVISILQAKKFVDRYENLNSLFFNKALTTVDKKLKVYSKSVENHYNKVKSLSQKHLPIDFTLLQIDENKLTAGFEKELAYMEQQMEKNTMLDYINIPDSKWDDATKNPELMKLIKLVYVK